MKKLFICIVFVLPFIAYSQEFRKTIPSIELKTLEGGMINSSTFENNNKPVVLSFWATWCKPCINELNAISEHYDEWSKETGFKLIAVSIDDARNTHKVAPFVSGKGWEYEIYLDPNGDFKRAMNVNMVPHTFLFDNNMEVVWQHNSYAPGDEYQLYDLLTKVSKGEVISE